jgi:hypothetical protein
MKKRWEKWSFCESAFQWSEDQSDWGHDIEIRADSSLMILHCADAGKSDGGTYAQTFFFTLENGKFRKIADHVGERVF